MAAIGNNDHPNPLPASDVWVHGETSKAADLPRCQQILTGLAVALYIGDDPDRLQAILRNGYVEYCDDGEDLSDASRLYLEQAAASRGWKLTVDYRNYRRARSDDTPRCSFTLTLPFHD